MMFNYLRKLAVRQFLNLQDHIRLIVVHPSYIQQHVILAELLSKPLLYVRFDGKHLTSNDLQQQFDSALRLQGNDPARLNGVDYLILDECDRAEPQALSQLLRDSIHSISSGRVLVFSREMPRAIVEDDNLRQQTSFIPDDASFMLWDYTQRQEATSLLEVRAFGDGRVMLNGSPVDNWDGVLPRSLFFYLVDRGMTTRNEIFDTFWPNLTKREATNVFHVTKRKISEVLGIDLTTYWSGFYRISPDIHLSYDVVLFTEMVQNGAVAAPKEAADLLTRATSLYRGHFLYKMEMDWARKRREELGQDYSDALASLAKVKSELGAKEEALSLYLRAAANNRHREDLALAIMELYSEQGMLTDALRVYERLAEDLKTDLGMTPATSLQEQADALRQRIGADALTP